MKLNPDCVRDVLLYLEEHLEFDPKAQNTRMNDLHWYKLYTNPDMLKNYSENDIKYSIQKLYEADYIDAKINSGAGGGWIMCHITDITWNGHDFLNTVRGQTIWETTKTRAAKFSISSIRGMASIAIEVAKSIVTESDIIQKIAENLT